jgi:hypothetical protein
MKRTATWSGFIYFVAMTAALTFPGLQPFNTIRPLILGVPFVFAWYLFWILGSLLVFLWLHRVHDE